MTTAAPILLAEDNSKLREMYSDWLSACGYHVVSAADGAEALGLLATATPKLILLDIMMPNLNGIETCKEARKLVGDYVPIVFLSSLDRFDILHECVKAGGDDYIIKSDSLELLRARVAQWMQQSGHPQLAERRATILAEVAAEATNGAPTRAAAIPLSSVTKQSVCKISEFVREARAGAAKDFGKSVEEKLYLLGYVTGVVEHWSKLRDQDEWFFDCLSAVLRETNILTNHEICMMLTGFEELAADTRFGVARAHGHNDPVQRQCQGDAYVPVGLAEVASPA